MAYSSHSFIGRLTKDPEVKTITINGEPVTVANFTVAVDEDGRSEDTDFYDVVAWRKLAENVGKYLTKGRLVFVEGRPKKRSYDRDVNGTPVKIYVTEIRANTVQFLDRGPDQSQAPQQKQQGSYQQQQQSVAYGQQQNPYAQQTTYPGGAPF